MLEQAEQKEWLEMCYDRTNEKLWRYLYGILKNEDDAYDMVQTAFICLIDSADRVRHMTPDALDAYLFAIARNLAFKYLAKRKKTIPTDKMDCIATTSGIETRIENKQLQEAHRKALHAALSRLPKHYSEFISMKFFARKTNTEIAEALQIEIGSVRMLQTRTLRTLKKIFNRNFTRW